MEPPYFCIPFVTAQNYYLLLNNLRVVDNFEDIIDFVFSTSMPKNLKSSKRFYRQQRNSLLLYVHAMKKCNLPDLLLNTQTMLPFKTYSASQSLCLTSLLLEAATFVQFHKLIKYCYCGKIASVSSKQSGHPESSKRKVSLE